MLIYLYGSTPKKVHRHAAIMEVLKIKNNRDLMDTEVELVGTVIASFATNMGWWLKVVDSKGYSIFVFSPRYNFNVNDLIVIKGVVHKSDLYGVHIQGTRILRRKSQPVNVVNRYIYYAPPPVEQNVGLLSKINAKIWILIAVVLSLIASFLLYPIISGLT